MANRRRQACNRWRDLEDVDCFSRMTRMDSLNLRISLWRVDGNVSELHREVHAVSGEEDVQVRIQGYGLEGFTRF